MSQYTRTATSTRSKDGWFPTGDIATIDPDGYMLITDRSKDVIKSGGEWISSVQIENIGDGPPRRRAGGLHRRTHPKWDERPLLVVSRKAGSTVGELDLRKHLTGKIPSWWMPDAFVFVDEIPLGTTGKVVKTGLRKEYADLLVGSR